MAKKTLNFTENKHTMMKLRFLFILFCSLQIFFPTTALSLTALSDCPRLINANGSNCHQQKKSTFTFKTSRIYARTPVSIQFYCHRAASCTELKWILDCQFLLLCGTSPFPVPEQLTLAPGELVVDVSSSVPVRSDDEPTCGSALLESKARLRSLVVQSFLTFLPSLARFRSAVLMLLLSAVLFSLVTF